MNAESPEDHGESNQSHRDLCKRRPHFFESAHESRRIQRIGVNRRGIAPPDFAEPTQVDSKTGQRRFEWHYFTSAFNALLCGASG